MIVEGVALKAGVYTTDDGRYIRIREDDLDEIAEALKGAEFVSSLDHQNPSKLGIVKEAVRDGDGIKFIADVESHEVSVAMGIGDLIPIEGEYIDGQQVYTGSGWTLDHLSMVDEGRCSTEMGCGVESVKLSVTVGGSSDDNSCAVVEFGETQTEVDNLAEEVNVEELMGQIETLKQELESTKAELSSVVTERDELMSHIETLKAQEFEEAKAAFAEKYPDVELDGVEDMETLMKLSKAVEKAVESVKVQLSKHVEEDVKKPSKLDELMAKRDEMNRGA